VPFSHNLPLYREFKKKSAPFREGKLPLDKETFDKFNKVSKNRIKTDYIFIF